MMLSAAGCTESEGISASHHAILGGDPASDPEFGSTVSLQARLWQGGTQFLCSGVLIRDDIVLTAAHCLMDTEAFAFTDAFAEGRIGVATGVDALHPAKFYVASEMSVHPEFVPMSNGWFGNLLSENDIGILHLAQAIPTSEAVPAPMLWDFAELQRIAVDGTAVQTVGYGVDEHGNWGTRLVSTKAFESWCHIDDYSAHSCELEMKDGVKRVFPAGTAVFGGREGHCSGDSGGPVFAQVHGEKHVVGIVSFSDSECKTVHGFTTVPRYANWIWRTADEMAIPPGGDPGCSATPLRTGGGLFGVLLLLPCAFAIRRMRLRRS